MLTRRQLIAGLILGGAGFAGNWFKYALFLNVDFLFGSIFVMMALLRYGTGAGVVASLIASSSTLLMWNHPYAIVIFTMEALVVGFLNHRRKRADILLHDIAFWICIGAPLVWLFYHHLLHDQHASIRLIMLKQVLNGIFNTLLASIFFMILLSRQKGSDQLPLLRQVVFTIMVSMVLFPAFLFIFYDLRDYSALRNELLAGQTARASVMADMAVTAWLAEHQRTATALAPHLDELQQQLKIIIASRDMRITIINQLDRVVATTRGDLVTMMPYPRPVTGSRHQITPEVLQWNPPPEKGRNLMQRWAKAQYIAEKEIASPSPDHRWKAVVESSYAPLLAELRDKATTALAGLVFFSLLIAPISNLLSRRLTRSLESLLKSTRSLPEDIKKNLPASITKSSIREIAELVENFSSVRGILQEQHDSLLKLNQDLKEKNAFLAESEDRFRILVEVAPYAVFVNRDNAIEYVNPMAVALFGASSAEQLLGRSPYTLFDPDYHPIMTERIQALLNGRKVPMIEGRIIQLDRSVRYVSVAATAFVDGKGVAIYVLLHDITDQKLAQEQITLAMEELRARNDELARFNRAAVGRELRMIQLKEEVNELAVSAGMQARYQLNGVKDRS